jgi:hypothetical protein
MKKILFTNILDYKKYAITALLVVFIALSYSVKPVKAVTPPTLAGTCGILANFNYNGWSRYAAAAARQPNDLSKNLIGTVNFDLSKFGAEQSVISSFESATTVSETTMKITGTFAYSSYDADTGIYKYTTTIDQTGQIILFSVVPVNSGNSFLISGQVPALGQSAGPAISGVCQKV